MKKKLLLFFASILLVSCLFAIAISADEIYSDFTKEGANGEAPLFTPLGYAIDEDDGCICVEYQVNSDALEKYEAAKGTKVKYGIVVALGSFIENGMPLDSEGKAIGANANRIVVVNLAKSEERIIVRVTGLSPEQYDKELVLNLYTIVDGNVYYIDDSKTVTKTEKTVSYNSIKGPIEVTVGGFTYSTDGVTEPAADRIKQQNASNADYKKGSSESTWLYSILAKTIATGGSALGMPDAADFMAHYLENTGKDYIIDMNSFLSGDSGALASRNTAINRSLRAAELLARSGETLTINQLTEGHPMQWQLATQNWQYSLGSYFDDVDIIDLTVTEVNGVKTYTASIKYIVTDFYNWDTGDYNKFKDIISPHQLHELHKAGKAKEFMSYGEITYANITWTEGQTVDQIAGLN